VAKQPLDPGRGPDARKRRTREHVLADLSLVHVQYYIANAGFIWDVSARDYGYDLSVITCDPTGYVEPGAILIQLKATDAADPPGDGRFFFYDVDVRDYNLWASEPNPVYLILYHARTRRAFWLYFQRYLREDSAARPRPGARSVRIAVPAGNRVSTAFFRHARRLKQQAIRRMGADHHG